LGKNRESQEGRVNTVLRMGFDMNLQSAQVRMGIWGIWELILIGGSRYRVLPQYFGEVRGETSSSAAFLLFVAGSA
jgi:hypothetical protein